MKITIMVIKYIENNLKKKKKPFKIIVIFVTFHILDIRYICSFFFLIILFIIC